MMDFSSLIPQLRKNPYGINPALLQSQDTSVQGQEIPLQQQQPIPTPEPDSGIDANAMMSSLYHPSNTAGDAYSNQLAHAPNRADYDHSKLRKVMAVIAGAGAGDSEKAARVAGMIRNMPYDEAMYDYTTKLNQSRDAARIENTDNINRRITANDTVRSTINAKNSSINQQKEIEKEREAKVREEIQKKRADAYDFHQRHTEWTTKMVNGELVFVNPKDPSQSYSSGFKGLTDKEKIDFGVQGKLKEIGATEAGQEKLEGVREGNREKLETSKHTNREGEIKTRAANRPPPSSGTTTTTTSKIDSSGKNKETTVVRKPNAPAGNDANRQKAIDFLTTNKKPVTDANIKYLLDNIGKW